jgi:hypothetical protein
MQKDIRKEEPLSPEIYGVMRNFISAIRIMKLYPSNNPAYFKSISKSFESLENYLKTHHEFHISVNKSHFIIGNKPFEKDADLYIHIAQDLFGKGIRGVAFTAGLTEPELIEFYKGLVMSIEEIEMKSGISSILWENGVTNIKVTESGLDDVVVSQKTHGGKARISAEKADRPLTSKEYTVATPINFQNRKLILDGLIVDPVTFGANMIEFAKQTMLEYETVEDRLLTLYKEAGLKIDEEHPQQCDILYESLAKSVLALDSSYRNSFIINKLYAEMDAELANKNAEDPQRQLPDDIQEIQSGRFSTDWTVAQLSNLLKKSAAKKAAPLTPKTPHLKWKSTPIPYDIIMMVKDTKVYSDDELTELKTISTAGKESDIARASVDTLISLISQVKNPQNEKPNEGDILRFSSLISQLENMLSYLLKKRDYEYAIRIVESFYIKVDPEFQPRMSDAIIKASDKSFIQTAIDQLKNSQKNSPEYKSAHLYLSSFEKESTEVLLKLLAEEKDRTTRFFYLDMVKEIGRNQMGLLESYLSDVRWYIVRNIVNILGDIKAYQSMALFLRVADHQNVRIRQEVIRGLINIGGKKAANVLVKFLKDKDDEVIKTAIRAFSEFPNISFEETKLLEDFLECQPINKKRKAITLEAIKVLGKIGDHSTAKLLDRYSIIRWWKSGNLQEELRNAAQQAIKEIARRHS